MIQGYNDKVVQAYHKLMVSMAVMLGAEEAQAKEEMKEALFLERELADFSLTKEKRRNITALYNPMTITEIQKLYPEISFLTFINGVHGFKPDNAIEEDEVLNVATPEYIASAGKHLETVSGRVVANYIIWRFVKESIGFLNFEAQVHYSEFDRVLSGKYQEGQRWEKCVKSVAGLADGYR